VTRPLWQRDVVAWLAEAGINECMIERATGIPRQTFRLWRSPRYIPRGRLRGNDCPRCGEGDLDTATYAYLLGLYLGDGYIATHARRVLRLRVTLDVRYSGIIEECRHAMDRIAQGRPIGMVRKTGCVEVCGYWKHWRCLFPQMGKGPKHRRPIVLEAWQDAAVTAHPGALLRGLIHSDGWRGVNHVKNTDYPRYLFSNCSGDILDIFGRACDAFGVRWRRNRWNSISIARATDVAKLDLIIGLKR
jgi:hypothetical protein